MGTDGIPDGAVLSRWDSQHRLNRGHWNCLGEETHSCGPMLPSLKPSGLTGAPEACLKLSVHPEATRPQLCCQGHA